MLGNNILDFRTIHTRAYPNPDPPEIVDNPESILKGAPTPKIPTISSHIHRDNSAPENLIALAPFLPNLDLPNGLLRTRSFNHLDQQDLEPYSTPSHSGQHTRDGGTPPFTPPSIHFIQNLGLSHPRSAQQTSAGPNIPVIQIPAAQANSLPHQNIIMVAWYVPLVLPQPLLPLPNDYQ